MKINKKKLGFTLVELLVVIAILAVLATVAIIGYSSFINEAHKSNDNSVVTELNYYLKAANPLDEKIPTATDAAEKLEGCGLNIAELQPSASGSYYGYNYEDKEFVVIEDLSSYTGKKLSTFIFAKTEAQKNAAYQAGYSVYLQKDYPATASFDAVNGLDVGEASVAAVNYTNTTSTTKDVVIRTNGGTLTVGSSESVAKGQIWHYGTLDNAIIYTEDTCFHTHGKIAQMNLEKGKAIAEDKGYVALVQAAENTLVEEKDTGVFYIPSNATTATVNADVAATLGYTVTESGTTAGEARNTKLASTAYEIADKFDLIAFRDAVNAGYDFSNINVVVTNDIDMSGYHWTSLIGNSKETKFVGTFNGNHHRIINLSNYGVTTEAEFTSVTAQTTGSGFGLFGYTGDAEIKNLEITVYGSGSECVAGLVADSHLGNLRVENISVYGSLSATKKVAGIVGVAAPYNGEAAKAEFVNCYNYATITSSGTKAAGIVASNGTLFSNCHNYGTINCSGQYCAGIGAWVANEYTYSNCTNEGTINCGNYYYYNLFDSNIIDEPDSATQASKENYIVNYYRHVGIVENYEYNWEEKDFNGYLVGIAYDAEKHPFKYTNAGFDYYYSDFNAAFNKTSIRVSATDHTYQIIYDFTSTTVQDTSKYPASNYTFTIGSNVKVSCDFKVNVNTGRNFTINGNHSGYTGTIEFTSGAKLTVGEWSTTTHGTYSFINGTLQEPVQD